MRLANGIVIDKEATFGALKFSALRREVQMCIRDRSAPSPIITWLSAFSSSSEVLTTAPLLRSL